MSPFFFLKKYYTFKCKQNLINKNNLMEKIWTKNYPKDIDENVDLSKYKTFVDLFNEGFEKYHDLVAFENMGKSITFKELDEHSKNFSNFLINKLNIKQREF